MFTTPFQDFTLFYIRSKFAGCLNLCQRALFCWRPMDNCPYSLFLVRFNWYTTSVLNLVWFLYLRLSKSEQFCNKFTALKVLVPEAESRTQSSRPRTQKKSEAKAKDRPSEDKPLEAKDRRARGQGQGPKTQAQVLSKKKVFPKFFRQSPQKNVFQKISQALHKILTIQKMVLSSSRGQTNFRGLEASRPRPRSSKCVLEAKDVLEDSTSA